MLQNLYIKNYALIDEVNLDFKPGLTIITGETGAGKSILLGGLELIRGKRAQQGLLKDDTQKSIVEVVFNIKDYQLKPLFEEEDLDYDDETIIRRELLPSGKSRAFVNDSPARLDSLSKLSDKLLDIHSQHQTLELNQKSFQFELLDAVAGNEALLSEYKKDYQTFIKLIKKLDDLISKLDLAEKELSYKKFQLEELNALKLDDVDFDLLEQQIKTIDHQETISQILSESLQKLDDETIGVLSNIIDLKTGFQKIAGYHDKFQELSQRFESLHWEIQDIIEEVNRQTEANDFDPAEQERLQNQYAAINNLLLKHQVLDVEELKNLRNQLASEVTDLSSLEDQVTDLKNDLKSLKQQLEKKTQKLHQNRLKTISGLIKQIETILTQLSMSNTRLKINLNWSDTFLPNGKDQLEFLISSDKGHSFGDIKRIASGGELSRLMLAVKTVLSKYKKLPTIIFDEIDTGISGEVAQNMAEVLKKLAENMQVLVITHLPQIAVKGDHHFKVYKTTENNQITTKVKQLNQEEQVFEIAEMLEGKQPSDSALKHARHLLSN
jgi:DNA repair protein RecN (Recombination protein N)